MSITRNRELSQFGSFIYVENSTRELGITTEAFPYVGIGTTNPECKLHVFGNTCVEGNIEADSFSINGASIVDASLTYWTLSSNKSDIYRIDGNIGIGTTFPTQKLDVRGNVSGDRFISTTTSESPFSVNSTVLVSNLNADFLRGRIPPGGNFVGDTDTQTLTNKTLTSPRVNGSGISLYGSVSGTTVLTPSSAASGTLTLPAVTGTQTIVTTGSVGLVTSGMIGDLSITNVDIAANAGIKYSKLSFGTSVGAGISNTDVATNAAISYSKLNLSNSIRNSDIVVGAGITNGKLATPTISGVSLGSNLNTLTFGTYLTGSSYNGSSAVTLGINASPSGSTNIVARDGSGNFSAGTITATLNGNATTSTSSTTATNATNVTATTSSTSSSFKVPFLNTTASTTGNYGLLQDSAATFTYNPSTNTLTAGTFSGTATNATTATTLSNASNITTGTIASARLSGTYNINISGSANSANTAGTATNLSGGSVSATSGSFSSSVSIPNSGTDLYVGCSAEYVPSSSTATGFNILGDGGLRVARNDLLPIAVLRQGDGGGLINFHRTGSLVGAISVAGTTGDGIVSYGTFLGSHWSRLIGASKPDIPIGTILETVDQLMEWKVAVFSVNGEEKVAAYHGPKNVGDTAQINYEGSTYSAVIKYEGDSESGIEKNVYVKISDTPASKAVYGVFLGWDEEISEGMVSTWNDLNCASVGNYFIRMSAGQTPEIGDLVESDGTGCGVVQDDDIIRSKTVGKITSTIPQVTYEDGSFLVTCVLYCG